MRRRAPTPGGSWLERAPSALDLPVLWAAAVVVHASALRTWFAQDDVTYLARAMGLAAIPWSVSRLLFEGVAFRTLHALFGLEPLPYHVVNLAFHAINVALIYAIARQLSPERGVALAAGLVFGVSSIAFTPLHWATGLHELLASSLTLGAIFLYLSGRQRGSTPLLWLGAVVGLGAALTKENTVLLPLLLLAIEARCRPDSTAGAGSKPPQGLRPAWSALAPQIILSLGFVAAYLATLDRVPVVAAAAYSRDFGPAFLVTNLATYLAWCVRPFDSIRDLVATAHPELLWTGMVAAALAVAALWMQRGERSHLEEVGAVAFLAFLLPVIPLRSHTYLYYLYLPWAGASWLIGGATARVWRQRSRWVMAPAVLAIALAALEFHNVRARELARTHGLARDKTIRESELLYAAIHDLRAARLPHGTSIALINPVAWTYFSVADADTQLHASPSRTGAYVPLEAALRHGEALDVFVPGVRLLGFGRTVPLAWEDAQVFWFKGSGALEALGTGSLALAQLGEMNATLGQWEEARQLYQRTRERGDTLAPSTLGLMLVEAATGHDDQARRYAAEFLRRWPDDPRAAVVDSALRAGGSLRLGG